MSPAQPIRISPGDVVDEFELLEVLAEGGSSTTFRALQRPIRREVAFKYLHPALFEEDAEALAAAQANAVRVAQLEHPHVATVYAAGEHGGGMWIASTLPRGSSLAELLAARRVRVADVGRIVGEVAAALAHAHALGIVHRDVRPECLSVDARGHATLRDFGVTRTSGRTGLLTRAEVLDALRWTAPELVLGRPATAATDVYALASVAVTCLTGAPPYADRPTGQYVLFRASAPPPVLTGPDAVAPPALNAAIAAAMALEPGVRPAPVAFAEALAAALGGLPAGVREDAAPFTSAEGAAPPPVPAVAPDPRDATRVEARRPLPVVEEEPAHRTSWQTLLLCAMLALVAGAGALFLGRTAQPEPPAPLRVGAYALGLGGIWVPGRGAAGNGLRGKGLDGPGEDAATLAVLRGARLPGDPVPPDLLPPGAQSPAALRSGRTGLVAYESSTTTVLARPRTSGTLVAECSATTSLGRCAALLAQATGPGRDLPVAPARGTVELVTRAMLAVEQATGIASGELEGERTERAGAASRLANDLREAAASLEAPAPDPGTTAAVERLRAALAAESAALEDLGGAIDRESDGAFASSRDAQRAAARDVRAALSALRRAGYPVEPAG